ncbi:hypothetical protein AB0H71_10995 [Nocardia sp. NPDC050697]|uniref:hypothetical protein n=1 Tax=Nocardia sp. NPDC050697 TaxID=3155158 RepID=UPI0033EA50EF
MSKQLPQRVRFPRTQHQQRAVSVKTLEAFVLALRTWDGPSAGHREHAVKSVTLDEALNLADGRAW